MQLTFTPASYMEGVQGQLEREPGMTVASWQQRPESRGYVRLRSADPFEPPIIQPNYLGEESDRRVLLAGMKLARRLLASKPLEPYYEREDFPGPTGADRRRAARAPPSSAARRRSIRRAPAAWGPRSDPMAVVDDQLRVHGLEGLRVVDASIMPTHAVGQSQRRHLMIAEKASDLIRGRAAPRANLDRQLSSAGCGFFALAKASLRPSFAAPVLGPSHTGRLGPIRSGRYAWAGWSPARPKRALGPLRLTPVS